MKYNFDQIVDRKGSQAIKVDNLNQVFGREDLIPMWVADMDFETPLFIRESVKKQAENLVWGYTKAGDDYWLSIQNWLKKRHGWSIALTELGFVGGIVPGLSFAVNALTNPGDKVVIQPPVYPPFFSVVKNSSRSLVFNPLWIEEERFKMDFDQLEELVSDPLVKMLILCNPHNPGGRSWSKAELARLAEICYEHNVIVVSDEIHADLTHKQFEHTPFALASEKAKQIAVTFMAPSKTFNMAGLASSFYIIQNPDIYERFQSYVLGNDLAGGHLFAFCAAKEAFEKGEEWLSEALDYINENIKFVVAYLEKEIPDIKPMIPDASFLIWLDFSKTGLTHEQIKDRLVSEARLAFNDGLAFGGEGEYFMRMNVGCSRSILVEAMDRMKKAFNY
ncbi:MAG: MalY/PatB family protein [Bacteroidales bacterium]